MEFGGWLFDKVADVCYDMLDYLEQYQNYTKNLKVLNVSAIPERKQSAVGIADSQSGSAGEEPYKLDQFLFHKLHKV